MVSDILIQAVEAVVTSNNLPALGRTSAEEWGTGDSGGMLHIQKVFIGTKLKSAIPAIGRSNFHATKSSSSEIFTMLCRGDVIR